jgi:hypothetical protein
MSAWERARHIPWSKIPQNDGSSNLEEQREQIFRELQRETIESERLSQTRQEAQPTTTSDSTTATTHSTKIPYSTMEMLKYMAFGGTLGSITGAVFGFMDSMRVAGESSVLKQASNQAKGRYIFQGTTRSSLLFGGFFAGFQMVKYNIRVWVDPGEVVELVGAGVVSISAMAYKPAFRPSIPYAGMLVLMDGAQLAMRKSGMNDK